MADLTLTCPLDGLRLGGQRDPMAISGDLVLHAEKHFHILIDKRLTCANGHEWLIRGDIIVARVRAGGVTDIGRV